MGADADEQPEVLARMAEIVRRACAAFNVPESAALGIAGRVTEGVLQQWPGCEIYIPAHRGVTLRRRNEAIWQRFTGDNHRELALEYGLTERAISMILRQQRKVRINGRGN